MFAAAGFEAIDLVAAGIPEQPDEEHLETAVTFEENALIKARHFHRLSGLPTVADDSGIAVDVLDGAPGVRSKRWSGRQDLSGQALDDANNALLLERLGASTDRRARYVCAAALCDGARAFVERGETAGTITHAPRAAGGVRYDTHLESAEPGRPFGQGTLGPEGTGSPRA